MDRRRYRRITTYFAKVFLGLFYWELLLPRIGFKKAAERTRSNRLQNIAQGYYRLAVSLGGVMIKVGQFLSARMDVLPEDITAVLAALQDEVPPVDFKDIRSLAEHELGGSLESKYASFDSIPLASASLGQVHRASLKQDESTPDFGVEVIVKVQRPDIETIINTDLSALRTAGNWIMRYKPVNRRADVPALLAEFSRVLYEEIDYLAEGRNADQFAENFAEVQGVRIPAVVWPLTTKRVLTLENVLSIKITDYTAIEKAGIERAEVAERLFDIYMRQIFTDGFFHADPHPGNLFVDPNGGEDDGDWQLTFVDFGMVGHVPPNTMAGMREMVIGTGTGDARRLVNSYKMLNLLLPHADTDLLEQMEAAAFERFWGKSIEELRDIDFDEMHEFAKEFREILYEMPFQVPQDLIFLFRTIAILSGMCTGLEPQFNFWDVIVPYAKKLVSEEVGSGFLSEVGHFFQTLIALPNKVDSLLDRLNQGRLTVGVPGAERRLARIDGSLRRVVWAILFFAFLTNGVELYLQGEYALAGVFLAGGLVSLVAALLPGRRMR